MLNKIMPGLEKEHILEVLEYMLFATLGLMLLAEYPLVAIAIYFIALYLVKQNIRIEELERKGEVKIECKRSK